jgi:hypothetical protein
MKTSTTPTYSSCKVVKVTKEKFVEFATVANQRIPVEVEADIHWLQESETTISFLHGGKEIKKFCTHNDYYGYLTSIDHSETQHYADTYSVNQQSTLEIACVTKVFQNPVIFTDEDREHNEKSHYTKQRMTSVAGQWRQKAEHDGEVYYPSIEQRVLVEQVTWSSKNDTAANAELAEAFKKAWAVE